MFFVINRSITDWSLSLAAKNQIRCFPKGKHKGLGPDQCRRKWSPELCFPLFTLELHLEHDYSPSRRFLLELLQNTLASSRARSWIEDTSARPLMVRKVHIPIITPTRPWPRHCIIVVSTKFFTSVFVFHCWLCVYVMGMGNMEEGAYYGFQFGFVTLLVVVLWTTGWWLMGRHNLLFCGEAHRQRNHQEEISDPKSLGASVPWLSLVPAASRSDNKTYLEKNNAT